MTGSDQSLWDPHSLMIGGKTWGKLPVSHCGGVWSSGAVVSSTRRRSPWVNLRWSLWVGAWNVLSLREIDHVPLLSSELTRLNIGIVALSGVRRMDTVDIMSGMPGVGVMVRVVGLGSEDPEFKSLLAVELIPGGVNSACNPSEVGKMNASLLVSCVGVATHPGLCPIPRKLLRQHQRSAQSMVQMDGWMESDFFVCFFGYLVEARVRANTQRTSWGK